MILYSREDCPLCEHIEAMLQRLQINFEYIDIDADEKLRQKYHAKVPVLLNDKHQELCFPFTEQDVLEFRND